MLPELSAVMIAGPIRARGELCLSQLIKQTALDRMEIVVVDLQADGTPLRGSEHKSVHYVRLPDNPPYSAGQAECVARARGGTIAFIEDHCYPSAGWAMAILEAFRNPHVSIVTYAFRNHNPERYLSRGFFMTEYGRWMCPANRGPVSIPSCNNVAYRRSDLEPFLRESGNPFNAEFLMQRRILANGGLAWLEPDAEVAHENWETFVTGLVCNHSHRRMGAARRVEAGRWGIARRIGFACALAATPLLHLGRLAASLRNRPTLWPAFVAALPVSTAVYVSTAYAEVLGCLIGPGSSTEKFTQAELGSPRKFR